MQLPLKRGLWFDSRPGWNRQGKLEWSKTKYRNISLLCGIRHLHEYFVDKCTLFVDAASTYRIEKVKGVGVWQMAD